MSLTFEEVRRVRFRMARPRETGYAVADVDDFVDKVEESFAAFEQEREVLRRELESASASQPHVAEGAEAVAQKPQEEGSAQPDDKDQQLAELRAELEQTRAELEQARSQDVPEEPAEAGSPESELQAQRERFEQEKQRLEEQRQELEAKNQQLNEELDRTRDELSKVRTERVTEAANLSGAQGQALTVHAAEDAAPAVTRLVQLATEQATSLVSEAEVEAGRKLSDAEQRASEIKTDARTRAERIESEARVNAEQMTAESEARAARLDTETNEKRAELFAELERQQEEFSGKVEALRAFEGQYRSNLSDTLRRLLDQLGNDRPEPQDVPELAQKQSETPRLDALAGGEQE